MRALITAIGLGADRPQDAVYPTGEAVGQYRRRDSAIDHRRDMDPRAIKPLVGLRPRAIEALHLVLSPNHGFDAGLVEVVDGVHAHHVWHKDLLVAPGDLQVTVAAIRCPLANVFGYCIRITVPIR